MRRRLWAWVLALGLVGAGCSDSSTVSPPSEPAAPSPSGSVAEGPTSPTFPGIVILGRLDGDAAQRISELDGSVTATVEASDD